MPKNEARSAPSDLQRSNTGLTALYSLAIHSLFSLANAPFTACIST
jgi:hypothetical protein